MRSDRSIAALEDCPQALQRCGPKRTHRGQPMDEDGPWIITRSAVQRCGPNLGHSGLLLDEDGPRIITRSAAEEQAGKANEATVPVVCKTLCCMTGC